MSENSGRYPVRGIVVTAASAGVFWWFCWDRMPAAPSAPQSVSSAEGQTQESARPHSPGPNAAVQAKLFPDPALVAE